MVLAPEKRQITLAYLARMAEGIAPVETFAQSYRNFPAGIDHDLMVICKGADGAYIEAVKRVLGKADAVYLERSDAGVDIHAYLDAARRTDTPWVCFLNTFSVIRKSHWLAKMFAAANLPAVGMVGATGSYESLGPSLKLLVWFINALVSGVPIGPETLRLFAWLQQYIDRDFRLAHGSLLGSMVRQVSRTRREKWHAEQLRSHRTKILRDYADLLAELGDIPGFPNPHIRTNGFMIRADFLRNKFPELGQGKLGAIRFESSRDGLTCKVLSCGLKVRLVGDVASYDIPDWPDSKTFRSGDQEHLLIGDNQTAAFELLPDISKELYRYLTWGDRAVAPEKFAHIIPEVLNSSSVQNSV